MRSHGVTSFPDPGSSSGSGQPPKGVNANSATFRSASQACAKYSPAGTVNPGQSSQNQSQLVQYAQCMRSHGVTDYPDPSSGTGTVQAPKDLNPNSQSFQSASKACQQYLPGATGK